MELSYLVFDNVTDRLVVGVLGVVVSVYSLYVEMMKEKHPRYKAYCDFNTHVSCTKALCSKYGKGFGFLGFMFGKNHILNQRNCVMGMMFYTLQILLAFLPNQGVASMILFYSSVVAGLGSAYLAFILLVILSDICVVCVASYILNGLIIYLNYSYYNVNG